MARYRGYEINFGPLHKTPLEISQGGVVIDDSPYTFLEAESIVDGWLDAP